MNAPFRPRDYALHDPDQSFWDTQASDPRTTLVDDIERDIYSDDLSLLVARFALGLVGIFILVPALVWLTMALRP
jgi:hypothetical protein